MMDQIYKSMGGGTFFYVAELNILKSCKIEILTFIKHAIIQHTVCSGGVVCVYTREIFENLGSHILALWKIQEEYLISIEVSIRIFSPVWIPWSYRNTYGNIVVQLIGIPIRTFWLFGHSCKNIFIL